MASQTDTVVFNIKVNVNQGLSGIRLFSGALSGLQGVATQAAKAIFAAFEKTTDLLIDGAEKSVKAYQTFEDALIVARRTMGLNSEAASKLGDALRVLALETLKGGVAQEKLAEIAGIAGTLGIRGVENVTKFTEAIAKIGVATDVSLQDAASKIPAILNIYKVSADEMGQATFEFGNMLNVLGNNLNATQSQILKVASTLASSAANAKMTEGELLSISAAVATIEKRFNTGGMAVKKILDMMRTNVDAWSQSLGLASSELRINIEENPVKALQMVLQAFNDIAQSEGSEAAALKMKELGLATGRAGGVFQALANTIPTMNTALALVGQELERQSSLNDEYATAMTTLTNQWNAFKTAINEVYLLIGEPLVQAMAQFLEEGVNPVLQSFILWVRESKFFQEIWPQIIETLMQVGEKILEPFQKFVTLLQEGSTFSEAFAETFPRLNAFVEQTAERFEMLGKRVKAFFFHLGEGKSVLEALRLALPSSWVEWWENLKIQAKEWWEILKGVMTTLQSVKERFERVGGISEIVKIAWEALRDTAQDLWGIVKPLFDFLIAQVNLLAGTVTGVNEMWKALGDIITLHPLKAIEHLGTAVKTVLGGMVTWIKRTIQSVLDLGSALLNVAAKIGVVGKESHEQSVFPDMLSWVDLNTEGMQKLQNQVAAITGEMQRLSQVEGSGTADLAYMASQKQGMADLLGQAWWQARGGSLVQSFDEAAQASQPKQWAPREENSPGTTAGIGQGVTINFQGTNIVDEQSMQGFTKRIQETMMTLQGRTVTA